MPSIPKIWHKIETEPAPAWLVSQVGEHAAQVMWQRGWRDPQAVAGFLDPNSYQPHGSEAFGLEITQAIARLKLAYQHDQKVAIWGDFDADGITATAVLWEGLGQFFSPSQLTYYIPDRFTESHGLSVQGIQQLQDYALIITCDTGSTSLEQILYAQSLGIDLIITDHHTLPSVRPPVVAIINPRYLAPDHPLYHLSGVAVAYKLIEALYQALPDIPQAPIEHLLDLVAIGLIADLVELKQDCRYLAQIGIEQLRQKRRPGVKALLEVCKKAGDRATDIGFGIAPRINSISRIWGDARKSVQLLISKDLKECQKLTELAERANDKRKDLQAKLLAQIKRRIDQIDLSTTPVILLADAEWQPGILGLVAGQVASEYGRPVILCTIDQGIAKGSARSYGGIDLYNLVKPQQHLLLSFGGHPFAAGLSFKLENLEILHQSLEQLFWQQYADLPLAKIEIDLELSIQEIIGDPDLLPGKQLFDQLKLLEPHGMGNAAPKILIRNCEFLHPKTKKIKDKNGQKLGYSILEFAIQDHSGKIPGVWWEHNEQDLPVKADVIVQLIDDTYNQAYKLNLLDLRPASDAVLAPLPPQPKISAPNLEYLGQINGIEHWRQLVGMLQYLARSGKSVPGSTLQARLQITDPRIWQLGILAAQESGWQLKFSSQADQEKIQVLMGNWPARSLDCLKLKAVQQFIAAVNEAQFRQLTS
ncbi:MAG: single-stranded-DNA-specific exonuclease RecJ [Pseudanabaenaceae cyanobacterium bins.68]|nr:single-stranded-DNA-specific exonuclease RecJ [Pseudanabaenaceae cyanobacterium bins.68]